MSKAKGKGPQRGDFVRALGGWWYICSGVWNDGVTFLATPMSGPEFPGRQALGGPRVVKFWTIDQVLKQTDLGIQDEGDPLKGSGR